MPAVQAAREAARRMQCTNNLKQIGLTVHTFHDAKQGLPAASVGYNRATFWMLVLPYAEQQSLYESFAGTSMGLDRMFIDGHNWWGGTMTTEERRSWSSIPWVKCPTRRKGVQMQNEGGQDWWHIAGRGPRGDYATVFISDRVSYLNGTKTDNSTRDVYLAYKLNNDNGAEVKGPFRGSNGSNQNQNWQPDWEDKTEKKYTFCIKGEEIAIEKVEYPVSIVYFPEMPLAQQALDIVGKGKILQILR